MSTPFLVLNRSNRRVIHQAASLAEARGYSEARDEPTTIAMLAEHYVDVEWGFVIQLVNIENGKVLAQSVEMDFNQATDEFLATKLLLVPACLADRKAVTP
jgi:hypothetical protein